MRIENRNPIVEIQETVEVIQGNHSIILEKGDKIEIIGGKLQEKEDYYDPNYGGTSQYYKNIFGLKYTDSVKYFAGEFEAYWLIDLIGSYFKKLRAYEFLVITVDVKGDEAVLTAREDTDMPIILKKNIDFTDLKVNVKFYLSDGVLMFPSDY